MGNVDHFKKLKIKLWIFISLFFILILSAVTLVLASVERDKYEELMTDYVDPLGVDMINISCRDLELNNDDLLAKEIILDEEIDFKGLYTQALSDDIKIATIMGNSNRIIIDEKFVYNVAVYDDNSLEFLGYLNYYDLFSNHPNIKDLFNDVYNCYLEGYVDQYMQIHPSKVELYKMEEEIVPVGDDKILTMVKKVYYNYEFKIDDTTNMKPLAIDKKNFPRYLYGLLSDAHSNPLNSNYKHLLNEYKKYLKDPKKLIQKYENKYFNMGYTYINENNEETTVERFVGYTNDKGFGSLFKIRKSHIFLYDDTMLAYELVAYPIKPAMITLIPLYFVSIFLIPLMYFIIMSFINKLREIENKEEEKRQALTTAVAHELKTPLGIIKTHNEGLQDNIDKDKEIEYRNVINNEINHMDSLILDLLQLSKLESKRMELKLEEIDLVELAHNQKLKLQNLYQKKNITFEILSNDEVLVYADLKLMMLVYSNILTNAIKNVRDNGNIKIEIEQAKNMAIVKFINNGPKLTQAEINNIWDTFYMKDKSRKHELGSTGLGLAIVKAILELHNAKYGCENTEDGVCFWFAVKK